jgi:hypothetical protein
LPIFSPRKSASPCIYRSFWGGELGRNFFQKGPP